MSQRVQLNGGTGCVSLALLSLWGTMRAGFHIWQTRYKDSWVSSQRSKGEHHINVENLTISWMCVKLPKAASLVYFSHNLVTPKPANNSFNIQHIQALLRILSKQTVSSTLLAHQCYKQSCKLTWHQHASNARDVLILQKAANVKYRASCLLKPSLKKKEVLPDYCLNLTH